MTRAQIILGVFGVAVLGFALYLLVQVRTSTAGSHVDPPHAKDKVEAPTAAADAPAPPPAVAQTETHIRPVTLSPHAIPNVPPPPAMAGHPHGLTNVKAAALPADIGERANPKLDALMDEANKAYDRGEIDEARSDADKVLAQQPGNARMLRILVSTACMDSDQPGAQKYYDQLTQKADREGMKTRCARYGVSFTDPAPQP